MMHRSVNIPSIAAAIMATLVFVHPAAAQISCNDVKYGGPNYSEKMDELAERAGLPDSYWNRYHESVVSALCRGNVKDVDTLIDNGSVKPGEAQAIAKVLGKTYKAKQRTQTGRSYGDSRKKFADMGACSACADNIAQYYTKKPDSPCGKLAKQALDGNPEAIKKVAAFPDYCKWSY